MMQTWMITVAVQTIGFALGLFKIYTDLQVKLKELDMRLSAVEKQDDEIYSKLDKMMEKLVAIEIALQNKADR
jgi:chaperonin cofactor prefoldin